jgi:hypothetical protein
VLWSILVSLPYSLLLLRGREFDAWIALAVMISSHGLAAIGYNHYYPQFIATALLACLTALVFVPEIGSLAIVALIGLTVLVTGVAYYPIWPVILCPVMALVAYRGLAVVRNAAREWSLLYRSSRASWFGIAFVVVCSFAVVLLAYLPPLRVFLLRFLSGGTPQMHQQNLHDLGEPQAYDLNQWAALFGAFSMHRVELYWWSASPSATPFAWVLVAGGLLVLLLVVCRSQLRGDTDVEREDRILARSLLFSVFPVLILQIYLGRNYKYTQYKALAYILPLLLLCITVPLHARGGPKSAGFALLATAGKLLLIFGLVAFRIEGALSIAAGTHRSEILDVGIDDMVQGIRNEDRDAYLLAFPSSPVMFPMWEYGLREIRGLVMQGYNYPASKETYLTATGVPHLWVLRDGEPAQSPLDTRHIRSVWAYKPLRDGRCRIEPAGLSGTQPQGVLFNLLGHSQENLWYEKDMDYWIFHPRSAKTLTLALKEHIVVPEASEVNLQIRYPVEKMLPVAVAQRQGSDILLRSDPLIFYLGFATADLLVLRVPGKGYSKLYCGDNGSLFP